MRPWLSSFARCSSLPPGRRKRPEQLHVDVRLGRPPRRPGEQIERARGIAVGGRAHLGLGIANDFVDENIGDGGVELVRVPLLDEHPHHPTALISEQQLPIRFVKRRDLRRPVSKARAPRERC
eukprot:scaffold98075_cov54-Phaeocystis_antarctica.AAC.2